MSVPTPPLHESLPRPPMRVSLPPSPMITSRPLLAFSVFSRVPPTIVGGRPLQVRQPVIVAVVGFASVLASRALNVNLALAGADAPVGSVVV